MLKLFSKTHRLITPLARTPARFAGSDWQKDREKAAEKEFAIREEKEKMKKLRTKMSQDRQEVSLKNPLDNVDDAEQVWKDREFLQVS